jgi:hypothetical protein
MLVTTLRRRPGHDVISMPSHADDDAAETT